MNNKLNLLYESLINKNGEWTCPKCKYTANDIEDKVCKTCGNKPANIEKLNRCHEKVVFKEDFKVGDKVKVLINTKKYGNEWYPTKILAINGNNATIDYSNIGSGAKTADIEIKYLKKEKLDNILFSDKEIAKDAAQILFRNNIKAMVFGDTVVVDSGDRKKAIQILQQAGMKGLKESLSKESVFGEALYSKSEYNKADKIWKKLSDRDKLRAFKDTGSYEEPLELSLKDIGGSTQDALTGWVLEHKKESLSPLDKLHESVMKESKFKVGDKVKWDGTPINAVPKDKIFKVISIDTHNGQDIVKVQDINYIGSNKYIYKDLAKDWKKESYESFKEEWKQLSNTEWEIRNSQKLNKLYEKIVCKEGKAASEFGFEKKFIGKDINSVRSVLKGYKLEDDGISPVINSSGKITGFIYDSDNDGYFKGKKISDFGMKQIDNFFVYEERYDHGSLINKYLKIR